MFMQNHVSQIRHGNNPLYGLMWLNGLLYAVTQWSYGSAVTRRLPLPIRSQVCVGFRMHGRGHFVTNHPVMIRAVVIFTLSA